MKSAAKKYNVFFIVLSIVLIFAAGLRLFGWANDTSNYYEMVIFTDEEFLNLSELFFKLIIFLNSEFLLGSFTVFLLIFSVIGVSVKVYALVKLSPIPFLSLALYIS